MYSMPGKRKGSERPRAKVLRRSEEMEILPPDSGLKICDGRYGMGSSGNLHSQTTLLNGLTKRYARFEHGFSIASVCFRIFKAISSFSLDAIFWVYF
jgi:hypothetical protein